VNKKEVLECHKTQLSVNVIFVELYQGLQKTISPQDPVKMLEELITFIYLKKMWLSHILEKEECLAFIRMVFTLNQYAVYVTMNY
jgi:hypothetical protein